MTDAPPRRYRFWPRWGARAVAESLLIVFSVVLALGLTQWVEDRRTAARTAEMRGYLIAEIRANRALLGGPQYLPHHQRLKTAFARATGAPGRRIGRAEAEPAIRALLATGLHQAVLQDAVWTSVSSGDLIEELDPKELFALAKLYRTQANMTTLNRGGYEQAMGLLDILADDSSAPRQMMRMMLFLEDLTAFERGLLAQYDATLALLDGKNGAAGED